MKKLYVLLVILLIGKISFAQIYYENFQSGTMPASYTLINDTNTLDSHISHLFPTAWSIIAQSDDTVNKVAASPSWFTSITPADRWMITSAINLPSGINKALFWRSKAQESNFRDGLKVKISTTGINKSDFNILAFDTSADDTVFTTKSFSLQSLAGMTIYVAFIQQSTDMVYIIVDDIKVDNNTGVSENTAENTTINVYPNPAKDFVTVNSSSTIKTVKVYNTVGQVVIEKSVKENMVKIAVSELNAGVYFITTETEKGTFTKKINIL